jgi:hypothetical protein
MSDPDTNDSPGVGDVGPEPVPVTAEQLAAGRDAVPAEPGDEEALELAAESHDDAGPEQEQPE